MDYLRTERGEDDDDEEPDYRNRNSMLSKRRSVVETENQFDEVKADQLEFLRQLWKVMERMDSGGLLLKHIYGGSIDMDESEETIQARKGKEKLPKLK